MQKTEKTIIDVTLADEWTIVVEDDHVWLILVHDSPKSSSVHIRLTHADYALLVRYMFAAIPNNVHNISCEASSPSGLMEQLQRRGIAE